MPLDVAEKIKEHWTQTKMKFQIVDSKCNADRLAISPDHRVTEKEFKAAIREMAKSEVLHPALKFEMEDGDILILGIQQSGPINPQQIAAISAFLEAAIVEVSQHDKLDARSHAELVELFSKSSGLDVKPES
jgi:hypothetical protein